jgi:hypothetical protein
VVQRAEISGFDDSGFAIHALALAGIIVGTAADDFRGKGGPGRLGHTTGSIGFAKAPLKASQETKRARTRGTGNIRGYYLGHIKARRADVGRCQFCERRKNKSPYKIRSPEGAVQQY